MSRMNTLTWSRMTSPRARRTTTRNRLRSRRRSWMSSNRATFRRVRRALSTLRWLRRMWIRSCLWIRSSNPTIGRWFTPCLRSRMTSSSTPPCSRKPGRSRRRPSLRSQSLNRTMLTPPYRIGSPCWGYQAQKSTTRWRERSANNRGGPRRTECMREASRSLSAPSDFRKFLGSRKMSKSSRESAWSADATRRLCAKRRVPRHSRRWSNDRSGRRRTCRSTWQSSPNSRYPCARATSRRFLTFTSQLISKWSRRSRKVSTRFGLVRFWSDF